MAKVDAMHRCSTKNRGVRKAVISMGLDGNGIVDGGDLGILFTIWGTTGQIP